jgi:hypothetical protein
MDTTSLDRRCLSTSSWWLCVVCWVIALLVVAVLVPLRLERFDDLFRFEQISTRCVLQCREGVSAGLGEREAKLNPGRGGGKAIQPLFLLAGAADTTNTILPSSLSLSFEYEGLLLILFQKRITDGSR